MKKVLILGGSGMLGSGVLQAFTESNSEDYSLSASLRATSMQFLQRFVKTFKDVRVLGFDAMRGSKDEQFNQDSHPSENINLLFNEDNKPDYVINCIGVIKPYINKDVYASTYINSSFPHYLSQWGKRCGVKIIHITTDCVFDGKKGGYTESDPHTELDLYGRSKSLGEPNNCMVLRTSIIGEEMQNHASLISWAKSQAGKEVNGFTNHYWNGVTTKEYGYLCKKIIEKNLYQEGKFHIFSPGEPLSKLIMLKLISDKYDLSLHVYPHETEESCDRSLNSIHQLCNELNVKPFRDQLKFL